MAALKRPMINEALRLVRLYWGLSQVDLSKQLELSQSMISGIERGTKSVTLEVLERYSTGLGIRMSQLMFFAEQIEGDPPVSRGKLIVASKILKVLDALKPLEAADAQ